jgi:hypothetical protein
MSKWFWLGIGLVLGVVGMVAMTSLQPYNRPFLRQSLF